MTSYNEQAASATTLPYRRVRHIDIRNPPNGLPQVSILEADAVVLNGRKIHTDEGVGGISVQINAAALAESFELRNPADDSPLGQTATGAQLMALLYSWSRAQQEKRDALQASAATPPAV